MRRSKQGYTVRVRLEPAQQEKAEAPASKDSWQIFLAERLVKSVEAIAILGGALAVLGWIYADSYFKRLTCPVMIEYLPSPERIQYGTSMLISFILIPALSFLGTRKGICSSRQACCGNAGLAWLAVMLAALYIEAEAAKWSVIAAIILATAVLSRCHFSFAHHLVQRAGMSFRIASALLISIMIYLAIDKTAHKAAESILQEDTGRYVILHLKDNASLPIKDRSANDLLKLVTVRNNMLYLVVQNRIAVKRYMDRKNSPDISTRANRDKNAVEQLPRPTEYPHIIMINQDKVHCMELYDPWKKRSKEDKCIKVPIKQASFPLINDERRH